MVVKDGVVAVAFRIDVDVVTTEIVREGRTRQSEAVRVVHDLTASQHPLTQTERDVGAEVERLLQRQVRIQLQGHHLLRIEAEAQVQLARLTVACRQYQDVARRLTLTAFYLHQF